MKLFALSFKILFPYYRTKIALKIFVFMNELLQFVCTNFVLLVPRNFAVRLIPVYNFLVLIMSYRIRHATLAWCTTACTVVPCARSTGRWSHAYRSTLWGRWPWSIHLQFRKWMLLTMVGIQHQPLPMETTRLKSRCRLYRMKQRRIPCLLDLDFSGFLIYFMILKSLSTGNCTYLLSCICVKLQSCNIFTQLRQFWTE